MRKKIYTYYDQYLKSNTFLSQAIKYLIVGGVCTLIDFSLLYILTCYYNNNYITASVISFLLGAILNYYLCTLWIFKIRVIKLIHHEFIYYIVITLIGLVINILIIWSLTTFIHLYFMLSKLLSAFVTYWWNFSARKYFLHTIK